MPPVALQCSYTPEPNAPSPRCSKFAISESYNCGDRDTPNRKHANFELPVRPPQAFSPNGPYIFGCLPAARDPSTHQILILIGTPHVPYLLHARFKLSAIGCSTV